MGCFIKERHQGHPCPLQTRFYRWNRRIEQSGDLLERESVHLVEEQGGAIGRRKPLQRLLKELPVFKGQDEPLWINGIALISPELIDARQFGGVLPYVPTAHLITTDIQHNTIQPGRKTGGAAKRAELGVGADEGLLGCVLCLLAITEQ